MQITNKLPLSPAPALLSPFLILYKSRLKAAAGAAVGRCLAGAASVGGHVGSPQAGGCSPPQPLPGLLWALLLLPVQQPELTLPGPPAPKQDPWVLPPLPSPEWPHETGDPQTHRELREGVGMPGSSAVPGTVPDMEQSGRQAAGAQGQPGRARLH